MKTLSQSKKIVPSALLGLSLFIFSNALLADEDCDDPIVSWQPREALRQQLETDGWTVYRIKLDDGCYEVKAHDASGNRIEATFSPSSLTLLDLENEDDEDDRDKYDDEDDRDKYDDEDEKQDRYQQNNSNTNQTATEARQPNNRIVKSRPVIITQ